METEAAIASEMSNSCKGALATTDFLAQKMQLVNHCENPLLGTPGSGCGCGS